MEKILILNETEINEIYFFLKRLRNENLDINNELLDRRINDIENVTNWKSIPIK